MKTPTYILSKIASMTVIIATLNGCATGFPGARPLTYVSPGETRSYASTGLCPHESISSPQKESLLAAAIISTIASQALSNFGTALKNGAEGGALSSSTSTLNMTLDPGTVPRCIIIVRGSFEPSSDYMEKLAPESIFGFNPLPPEINRRLNTFNLDQFYRIDHLIEISIMPSGNHKALTFAPLFVRLNKSIDGSKSGERDLTVKLEFNTPGNSITGSVVNIQDRQVGEGASIYSKNTRTGHYVNEAPWFGSFNATDVTSTTLPGKSKNNAKTNGLIIPPAENEPKKISTTIFSTNKNAMPVTLVSTVVETRPTKEGLAFIASVFSNAQPQLETGLKQYYDPIVRDAAKTEHLSNSSDYTTAMQAAEINRIEYCNNTSKDNTPSGQKDRINKSATLRVSQLNANSKAMSAGMSEPFTDPVKMSSDISIINESCH